MLIVSFVIGPFSENCYVLAHEEGGDAVIVDPGMGCVEPLQQALTAHHLHPAGMVFTHGHIDHVGGAREVSELHEIPSYCPVDDRHLLSEPMEGLADFALPLVMNHYGTTHLTEPETVVDVMPDTHHEVAGFDLEFIHAPGHTPGCSMIRFVDEEHGPIIFSGDVLFAGAIGRTDLPGGDPNAMTSSLRDVVWPLPDATHVLPGHGGSTQMGYERKVNPYLQL